MSKKSFLEKIEVKTPCSEDWNEMRGSDEMRFCSHCSKSVNNLSAMTRKRALKIVRESNGNLCVRYVKNPVSSAPMFSEDLYQISRRAPRLAVGVMTAALSLSSMAYAQGGTRLSERNTNSQTEISQDKDSKKDKTESSTASISGTILDSTGAVIPGIIVSLNAENEASGRTETSNDEGFYEFKNLASGTYTLKAEGVNGFLTFQAEGIVVSAGDELKNDVTMEVGGEYVTVGGIGAVEYELPLLQAVSEEKTDEIKSLLANGADVNGKDKNYDGITAIFIAVENGNVETVRTLLDFGAKINVRDQEKRTPLMRLDSDATPELVKLLLSYGAKINRVDKEENNVLHHVAVYVSGEVLQMLIDEGADIDAQNETGETPLMIAANYENLECVRALLAAGANVNLRDKEGKTALGIARENEHEEIAELLASYGATE